MPGGKTGAQVGDGGECWLRIGQLGEDALRQFGGHVGSIQFWQAGRRMSGDDQAAARLPAGAANAKLLPRRELLVAVDNQDDRGVETQRTGSQPRKTSDAVVERVGKRP